MKSNVLRPVSLSVFVASSKTLRRSAVDALVAESCANLQSAVQDCKHRATLLAHLLEDATGRLSNHTSDGRLPGALGISAAVSFKSTGIS